ncbi:MAG: hypothetical protein HYT19_00965 [Candidatus Nealsonbacteria bacterium]|nr:hypothetical protein [Candidatus Nealsonbacteria bacterium]
MEGQLTKSEQNLLTKSCRVFASLNFFLISAIFILIFGNLLGINLPKYYPLLHSWSILPLQGPAMGYFSAIGFAILLAFPLSLIFYLSAPYSQKYLEIRFKTFKNLSTAFIILGIFYFIAKEGKEWGIEKMALADSRFFNAEMLFFIIILGLFLIFTALLLILEKKIFE